jgi:hypothetical protein
MSDYDLPDEGMDLHGLLTKPTFTLYITTRHFINLFPNFSFWFQVEDLTRSPTAMGR